MFLGDNRVITNGRTYAGPALGLTGAAQPLRTEPNSSDSHDTFKLAGDTSDMLTGQVAISSKPYIIITCPTPSSSPTVRTH